MPASVTSSSTISAESSGLAATLFDFMMSNPFWPATVSFSNLSESFVADERGEAHHVVHPSGVSIGALYERRERREPVRFAFLEAIAQEVLHAERLLDDEPDPELGRVDDEN